jgi:phosphotransferase system enzyme I (PtsP)
MLPFVSEVWEVDQAQKLIDMEFRRASERDIPLPARFDLGVMIEVPSLLWQLESLFRRVSFVAVGTNDLMQYLFASDSRSDMVQDRYDPLSPPMVRALRHISVKARDAGVDVSVCGEMASKPLEAMVLVALGYRSLSMPVHAIGRIKDTINSMKAAQLSSYLNLLAESGSHSLREKLENYAKDHKIKIKV